MSYFHSEISIPSNTNKKLRLDAHDNMENDYTFTFPAQTGENNSIMVIDENNAASWTKDISINDISAVNFDISYVNANFIDVSAIHANNINVPNINATTLQGGSSVVTKTIVSDSVVSSNISTPTMTSTNIKSTEITTKNITATSNVNAANITATSNINAANVIVTQNISGVNDINFHDSMANTIKIVSGTESKNISHPAGTGTVGNVPYLEFNLFSGTTYRTDTDNSIGNLQTGVFKMYHYGLDIRADDGYHGTDTNTHNHDNFILSLRTQNEGGFININGGFFGMRFEKPPSSTSNYNLRVYMKDNTSPYNYISIGKFENDNLTSGVFFTGQHRNIMNTTIDTSYVGLLVSSSGKYINANNTLKASINESLPVCIISNSDNDKKVFGVVSDKEDTSDDRSIGTGSYKSVYKKANINEQRVFINSVGEGAIWVCNKNGNLENGDYITSSTVPGYGIKQADGLLHNYTVAKITCDCDFSTTQIVKQKLKIISTTDASGNTSTEIDYDANGDVQYEDDLDASGNQQMEYPLETRFLQANGTQITETQYTTKLVNGENVYIACFVGCTYHCG
jgi:hypothetical protein